MVVGIMHRSKHVNKLKKFLLFFKIPALSELKSGIHIDMQIIDGVYKRSIKLTYIYCTCVKLLYIEIVLCDLIKTILTKRFRFSNTKHFYRNIQIMISYLFNEFL